MTSETSKGTSEFLRVFTTKANGNYPVTKYVSRSTGLEVVHAEIEGPLVSGDIVLATRVEDDDGVPRALEHLILNATEANASHSKFMAHEGMEGITCVDQTTFSLSTAGSDGFCVMLPILMDRIFHPVLKNSDFKIQVHQVTNEGKDSGRLYTETKENESTGEEKTLRELHRLLYPPESGYHYAAGGLLKNIRDNCCTFAKVKEFHKKFYTPRNTRLIVCGMVNPAQLFAALDPVIQKLVQKGVIDTWTKPWQVEDPPPITEPKTSTIRFLIVDDTFGDEGAPPPKPSSQCCGCCQNVAEQSSETWVTVGFRGPSAISEYEEFVATILLLEYLLDEPIQHGIVENDSSGLATCRALEYTLTAFCFDFRGFQAKKTEQIPPHLIKTIKHQLRHFDMQRMAEVIKRHAQYETNSCENCPRSTLINALVSDFLYANGDQKMFEKRVSRALTVKALLDKSEHFWVDMIQKRILNQKWVTVYAIGSPDYREEMQPRQRVDSKAKLLDQGSDKELLDDDGNQADSEPPKTLSGSWEPRTDSIRFHKITRYQNPSWMKDFKATLLVDDIASNFVYVSVLIDTSGLSKVEKKCLKEISQYMIKCPVMSEKSKLIPAKQVVAAMKRDLVSSELIYGINPNEESYQHLLHLRMQMDIDKVEQGMDWIRKILWRSVWKSVWAQAVTKHKGAAEEMDLDLSQTTKAILDAFIYQPDSPKLLVAKCPRQRKKVTQALATIRKVITDPHNIVLHVATSLEKLNAKLAASPIQNFANLLRKAVPFADIIPISRRLSNTADTKWMVPEKELWASPKGVVMGVEELDVSCLWQAVPGPTSHADANLAALLTTIQYFEQHTIRLSEQFKISVAVNEGLIYLNLECPCDIVGSYNGRLEILQAHLNGKETWSSELLACAKGSLIFQYVSTERTPRGRSKNSLFAYYYDVPGNWVQNLVENISKVQPADMQRMMEQYLKPLFTVNYACAVLCPHDQAYEVADGFAELGKKLETTRYINVSNFRNIIALLRNPSTVSKVISLK